MKIYHLVYLHVGVSTKPVNIVLKLIANEGD